MLTGLDWQYYLWCVAHLPIPLMLPEPLLRRDNLSFSIESVTVRSFS